MQYDEEHTYFKRIKVYWQTQAICAEIISEDYGVFKYSQ